MSQSNTIAGLPSTMWYWKASEVLETNHMVSSHGQWEIIIIEAKLSISEGNYRSFNIPWRRWLEPDENHQMCVWCEMWEWFTLVGIVCWNHCRVSINLYISIYEYSYCKPNVCNFMNAVSRRLSLYVRKFQFYKISNNPLHFVNFQSKCGIFKWTWIYNGLNSLQPFFHNFSAIEILGFTAWACHVCTLHCTLHVPISAYVM
jgi:hypothetical protein